MLSVQIGGMAPAPPLGDDAVSQTYPTNKGMSSTPPAAMTFDSI